MIPARIVERKRDGEQIPSESLAAFLSAYLAGDVPNYQMSAFLMAVYFKGLDADETDVFVRCMVGSGKTLDLGCLGSPRIDKHSTGGVGDKVSLVLAPLAASLGIFVPMMSGRGLGHTAGTLDKLEAISGFRTGLSLDAFRAVLESAGCAIIGATDEIVPLDKRLYALRDVTGTVPAPPLIAASIMSKKLAEDLTGLLLDVKTGSGAFIPEERKALRLARTMAEIGCGRGLPTVALLTAMDRPLGSAIGHGLETAEAIHCLRGEGPPDLRELVLRQGAEMLRLAEPGASLADTRARAATALDGGHALARFVRMVEAQGGTASVIDDPGCLATAAVKRTVVAKETATVTEIEPKALGRAVVALGGGRLRIGQKIDFGTGFELRARPGDRVAAGDALAVVHASDASGAETGEAAVREAFSFGDASEVALRPLVSHVVNGEDVVRRARRSTPA